MGLKYIGKGDWVRNVPARDLNDEEVKVFGEKFLLDTKLYKKEVISKVEEKKMSGIKAYRKIQLGLETTAGTEANATVLWRGLGVPNDDITLEFPKEDIGYVSGVDRSFVSKYLGGFDFESVEATYEQLPYILNSGVENTTGAADGSGSGKIYTFSFPTTASKTIKYATIEGGDDAGEEQMLYSFVKSFKITGVAGEACKMSATWVGRQLQPGTFTSIATVPAVKEILASKGKLYVDTVGSTAGTTQISNSLVSFDLSVDTGWTPVFTEDGSLDFSFAKHTADAMKVSLNLTFEHDASSIAQKVAWRAQTPKTLQLKFTGDALTTNGTTYQTYTATINLCGKWEKFDKLSDKNGNDQVTGTFKASYDPTAAAFGSIVVVNQVTTL